MLKPDMNFVLRGILTISQQLRGHLEHDHELRDVFNGIRHP